MKNHPNVCDRMKNARNYAGGEINGFSGYNDDIYDRGHIKVTKSQKRKKLTNSKGNIFGESLISTTFFLVYFLFDVLGKNKKSKVELVHQHPNDLPHGNERVMPEDYGEVEQEDVYEEKYDPELVCTTCNQIFNDKITLSYHR